MIGRIGDKQGISIGNGCNQVGQCFHITLSLANVNNFSLELSHMRLAIVL